MASKTAQKRSRDDSSTPLDPDPAPDRKRARNTEESVSMGNLPDVPLVEVFRHLDTQDKGRAAQVCQRWRRVLDNPRAWEGDEATIDLDQLTEEGEASLKTRQVKHVVILACLSVQKLQSFLQTMPYLQSLFLGEADNLDTYTLIKLFSRRMGAMEELYLPFPNTALLKTVCANMPRLKILRLQCLDEKWSDKVIQDLDLGFLPQAPMLSLKDFALHEALLGDKEIECLVKGFPNLTDLSISLGPGTTQAGIQLLSELPSLMSLELLPNCDTDVVIEPLLHGRAKLTELIFTDIFKKPVAKSISQMTSLRTLRIAFVKDYHLRIISQGLRNLTHLEIACIKGVTTKGLRQIAKMSRLKILRLYQVKILSDGMQLLREGLKGLRTLVLDQCPKVTPKALQHIAGMGSLQRLCLYGCDFNTEILLHLLHSVTLRFLNIHDCPAIPEESYKKLTKKFRVSKELVRF